MRQFLILLSFSILIPACSSKNEIPKDILSKQQMEDVLWDLLSGSEFLDIYMFPRDSSIDKAAKAQEWYDEIFRLHKTNRPGFQKSYTWYQQHPQIMKEVLDSITAKTASYNYKPPGQVTVDSAAIKADSTLKRDSILKRDSLLRKDSTLKKVDTVKRDLIKTGRRPDDTFAIKVGNNQTRKDKPGNLFLPAPGKSKLKADSLRRSRLKKFPE